MESAAPSPLDIALMQKLFDETNALKSEMGEDLNQFFVKAVDKKVSCT